MYSKNVRRGCQIIGSVESFNTNTLTSYLYIWHSTQWQAANLWQDCKVPMQRQSANLLSADDGTVDSLNPFLTLLPAVNSSHSVDAQFRFPGDPTPLWEVTPTISLPVQFQGTYKPFTNSSIFWYIIPYSNHPHGTWHEHGQFCLNHSFWENVSSGSLKGLKVLDKIPVCRNLAEAQSYTLSY